MRVSCALAWLTAALFTVGLLQPVGRAEEKGKLAIGPVGRFVAVDNVCAWPNLTVLRDGTIVATIFNQPSHGKAEGDVECWASKAGRFWVKRGTAAPHETAANRMNVAAGVTRNGDLVVVASGWSLTKDDKGTVTTLREILHPWICRSSDDGRTWRIDKESFPKAEAGHTPFIPFGDIQPGADRALRVVAYARDLKSKEDSIWMFRSGDDGKTWQNQARISTANNETAVLHLGGGKWIAAARSLRKTGQRLDLFRSGDDGATWSGPEPLTETAQHPAHLTRLKDGRVLLTYGNRTAGQFGVLAKLSADEGKSWGEPITLVADAVTGDCGYPSSVQLPNNEIVTAYYASGIASHQRYHMGVVIWNAPARSRP